MEVQQQIPRLSNHLKPQVASLEQQVDDKFVPYYGTATNPTAATPWKSTDSLFGVFIGINDLGTTFRLEISTINSKIFAEYQGLMETLFYAGARNFLFLNIPPIERSPRRIAQGAAAQALLKTDITQYNTMVAILEKTLKRQHPEVNIFKVDANAIFTKVLDNTSSYPQTSLYKNTTAYCDEYKM
jgi:phospholipase/lecithinase/hemolysin